MIDSTRVSWKPDSRRAPRMLLIKWPTVTMMSRERMRSVQWAAVTIHLAATIVPPQNTMSGSLLSRRAAWCGMAPVSLQGSTLYLKKNVNFYEHLSKKKISSRKFLTPGLNRLTIDNAHLVCSSNLITGMGLTCRPSSSWIATGKVVFLFFYSPVISKHGDFGVFSRELKRSKVLATRAIRRRWTCYWFRRSLWRCRCRRSARCFIWRAARYVAKLPSYRRIRCVAPWPVFIIVQISTVIVIGVIGPHVGLVGRVSVPRLTGVARACTGNITQIRASVIALLKTEFSFSSHEL